MTRTRLAGVACSIARASDLFGDAWTALIMRDALGPGTRVLTRQFLAEAGS